MRKVFINANHLIESNVNIGDEVLAISLGDSSTEVEAQAKVICSKRNATVEVASVLNDEYEDSLTFSRQAKNIAALLCEGDRVFADITSLHSCSVIALFIALNYISMVCSDFRVDTIMHGNEEVTSLAHLLAITSGATDRKATDKFLSLLIG